MPPQGSQAQKLKVKDHDALLVLQSRTGKLIKALLPQVTLRALGITLLPPLLQALTAGQMLLESLKIIAV